MQNNMNKTICKNHKCKKKHDKEYEVEISRLIRVFNNNIWENKKSVK